MEPQGQGSSRKRKQSGGLFFWRMAAGLLLTVYIVSDVFGLWAFCHSFHRRVLKILIPAGLLGILLGWEVVPWTSTHFTDGDTVITGLVGCIGIGFAIYMLVSPPLPKLARR